MRITCVLFGNHTANYIDAFLVDPICGYDGVVMRERVRHTQLLKSPYLWLGLVLVLAAALRFSRLGEYHNTYYMATVVSMLQSPSNFLFGSFDPVGIVTVDKPPASFWFQSIFVWLLGVHIWSITLPQVLLGIFSPATFWFHCRFERIAMSCGVAGNSYY